jgi:hypothetical protein
MSLSDNFEAEIVLEMYQSVVKSPVKQKRLKSSTFWKLFKIKSRKKAVVEKITYLLGEQGLNIKVKSGAAFGEESKDDWVILTPQDLIEKTYKPVTENNPVVYPDETWFDTIINRVFETEREVETYFITPILEKLGYAYDDICIGYSLDMFRGVKKTKAEADFVVFDGAGREQVDVLLIVEAKSSQKGINIDHIGQARSYARELLPSNYIISNGEDIVVFQFNGSLIPDDKLMEFNRKELVKKWTDFYSHVNKRTTIERKKWMVDRISNKGR